MHLRNQIGRLDINFEHLQEIRVRNGQYIILYYDGVERIINEDINSIIRDEHIREMLEYISQYSLYAYEQELKQGYITIEGGHRVGITGKTVIDNGKVKSLKYINGFNIRISHEIIGCANSIIPYIHNEIDKGIYHTLIISPPKCGKTTILRDLIRMISNGSVKIQGKNVGVVDERSELGACYHGKPQNDLGKRTDILDGCPKVEGMMMLVRSMSPEVIVVDEIGMEKDAMAIEYAIHSGCKIIASIHGRDLEEMKHKPMIGNMIKKKLFQRYIVLGNKPRVGNIKGVYNEDGYVLYKDNR